MARAHAQGIWAAGQEDVLRPFRDRYFGETLPLLISRADADPAVSRDARRLAVLLFPATLAEEATVSAVGEALRGQLTTPMRNVLREQELVLRTVIEARSTATSG
jgi:aminopeptidase N